MVRQPAHKSSVLCCLFLLFLIQAHGQYASIKDALTNLNFTVLDMILGRFKLYDTPLFNPEPQVIFLALTDSALEAAFQNDNFAYELAKTGKLNYFPYLMLPVPLPTMMLPVSAFQPVTMATLFNMTDPAANLQNTISNVTFVATSDPYMYWVGGMPPGAMINISQSWTAGKSRIYSVDSFLVPPTTAVIPAQYLPGLTPIQALQQQQFKGLADSFLALAKADAQVAAYLSNPDNVMTLMPPTNSAIQIYLNTLGISLDQLKGSKVAHELLVQHILPGQPWSTQSLPPPSGSLRTWNESEIITIQGQGSSTGNGLLLYGSGNVRPVFISQQGSATASPRSNIAAGKSFIHMLDAVLLSNGMPASATRFPAVSPTPPSPPPSPPPLPSNAAGGGGVISSPTTTAAQAAGSDGGGDSGPGTAKVVGIAVGASIGVILLVIVSAAVLVYFMLRRNKDQKGGRIRRMKNAKDDEANQLARPHSYMPGGRPSNLSSVPGRSMDAYGIQVHTGLGGAPMIMESKTRANRSALNIPGLIPGDPFLRSTAPQYSWTARVHDSTCAPVEAGVNDHKLDRFAAKSGPPVVRLNRSEVVDQIRLLNTGLLGKGSSALVFKGLWPSRFGPDAVLAIKVLKDPYESDPSAFEGFTYEAAVLASVRHPNVLRMYGYCLELPTACLIMELLPHSLKDKLYHRSLAAQGVDRSIRSTNITINPAMLPGSPGAREVLLEEDEEEYFTEQDRVDRDGFRHNSKVSMDSQAHGGAGNAANQRGVSGTGTTEDVDEFRLIVPPALQQQAGTVQMLTPPRQEAIAVTTRNNTPLETTAAHPENGEEEEAREEPSFGSGGLQLPEAISIMEARDAHGRATGQTNAECVDLPNDLHRDTANDQQLRGLTVTHNDPPTLPLKPFHHLSSENGAVVSEEDNAWRVSGGAGRRTAGALRFAEVAHKVGLEANTSQAIPNTYSRAVGLQPEGPLSPHDSSALNSKQPNITSSALNNMAISSANNAFQTLQEDEDPPSMGSLGQQMISLTVGEVLQLSADIAAGLAYLHRRPAIITLPQHPTLMLEQLPVVDWEGATKDNYEDDTECRSLARIVHRDLKPSNILINSQGRAKISDFGLARWHSNTTVYTHHLGVGTLRYMAPELLLGHYTQPDTHIITNRVDIYSLGMLMWEMLTCSQPWTDLSDAQIVAAVVSGARPPLQSEVPQIDRSTSNGSATSSMIVTDRPASFDTLPHLKKVVSACWAQRDMSRPTAAQLHQQLIMLLSACSHEHGVGTLW